MSGGHSFKFYDEFFENFSSKFTRKSYQNDIDQFLNYITKFYPEIKQYIDVERKHVIKFRNYLEEVGGHKGDACAPKTIARKLAAISSFYHFLVEIGEAKYNPATSVKRPRRDVRTPTNALSTDQVRQLFECIDAKKLSGSLHLSLLVTFFTTGLRKSEVLNLRFRNYREINEYKILEFTGKGGKIGQKLLHPTCVEALEHYLSLMVEEGRGHCPDDWLFQPTKNPKNPNELNKRLNPKTINEILDQYGRKIGLNFKISPHSARATFITELLDLGTDIYRVAREVNHSSVRTTQEYDKRRKKITESPVFKLRF
ncbi:MAG: tyrosine-type recombinase/integrase [Bacteriovoracaceae bacterium]|nr:tyrosine-type recombinase/integrase [Bacteriovoracaceae bacterium]